MTTTKTLIQAARMARACIEPEPFDREYPTPTDENGVEALIFGRNGTFTLTAFNIHEFQDQVIIDGVGAKGTIIRGGLRVPKKAFETMCREYVLHGLPTKEDEDVS